MDNPKYGYNERNECEHINNIIDNIKDNLNNGKPVSITSKFFANYSELVNYVFDYGNIKYYWVLPIYSGYCSFDCNFNKFSDFWFT